MTDNTRTTPKAETQGEFRARMRATYGDGRNGSLHWRANPAAQEEITARKVTKDQAWQAQLATWKQARGEKKAVRTAEQALRIEAAKQAGSIEEALRILGVTV